MGGLRTLQSATDLFSVERISTDWLACSDSAVIGWRCFIRVPDSQVYRQHYAESA